MKCKGCGREEELRLGFCFDCCQAGERRAARRTVIRHLLKCGSNLARGKFRYAWCDLRWAWMRLTLTGDYLEGGYFDWEDHDWRNSQ